MHKKKRNVFKEWMRGIDVPLSHKVAKSVCMPLNHIFQASADILSSFFYKRHHAIISKIITRLYWEHVSLTLSRIVCLISSLSSSCFLYLHLLSFSASLIASCLNLSCSCCSSLLVPLPSSLSPPTPGILSEIPNISEKMLFVA